jgi:hypothetical protein
LSHQTRCMHIPKPADRPTLPRLGSLFASPPLQLASCRRRLPQLRAHCQGERRSGPRPCSTAAPRESARVDVAARPLITRPPTLASGQRRPLEAAAIRTGPRTVSSVASITARPNPLA